MNVSWFTQRIAPLFTRFSWLLAFPGNFARLPIAPPRSESEPSYHSSLRVTSVVSVTARSSAEVQEAVDETATSPYLTEVAALRSSAGLLGYFQAATELYAIGRPTRLEFILGTGVGSGSLSVHILYALNRHHHSRLISVDALNNDPGWKLPIDTEPGFLVHSDLRDRWQLVLGSSTNVLPRQSSEGPEINLFLHDTLHTSGSMVFELRTVYPHLRQDGRIVCDDTMRNFAILEFAREQNVAIHFLSYAEDSALFAIICVGLDYGLVTGL